MKSKVVTNALVFSGFILNEVQVSWLESYVSKYISHNMFQWNLDHLLQMSLQPIGTAIFHKGFCVTFPKRFIRSFPLTKVGVRIDIISLFNIWSKNNVRSATIKCNNITFISFAFLFYNMEQVLVLELPCVSTTLKHNNIFLIVLGRCDGLCSMW